MIVEELKDSVLQVATEGKLVEQRENESAKKELGIILEDKKDNKRYQYSEVKNIPFKIPDNWVWVKLEDICLKITDGTHKTPKYTVEGIPFISVKDISNGKIDFSNTKFISRDEHKILYERCNPEYGDILITKVGTTGIPVIVDTIEEFSLFVSVALLKFNTNKIFNKFLIYFLNSPIVQKQVKENTRGIGNKNWVLDAIKTTILPLPPIEEQQRIVEKIEKLFAKLDEIKQIEDELIKIKEDFPNEMKKSIYLAAFQGKLSSHHEYDSNIDERINKIIIDKKIDLKERKRRKINDDYIEPYNIPNSWKWVKLGYLCDVIRGLTFSSSSKIKKENNILVLRGGNIDSKSEELVFDDNIYVDCSIPNENQYLQNGDTLIVASSGTKTSVGKSSLIHDIENNISFGGFMMVIRPYSEIANQKYISYQIKMYRNKIINDTNGYISNITNEILNNLLIPLPPIEEQQRIVDKIEQLLPLVDDIEKLIGDS